MLTETEQLRRLGAVRMSLLADDNEVAHAQLLALIRETPSSSPLYPIMVGAANWIKPLQQPLLALEKLYAALLELRLKPIHPQPKESLMKE